MTLPVPWQSKNEANVLLLATSEPQEVFILCRLEVITDYE